VETAAMTSLNISAIIITKNEEKNIAKCLQSLHFCSEIIIFDSFSTDNTKAICESFSNVSFFHTQWAGYSQTKQNALEKTNSNWILWIDADEEVPVTLQNEILNTPILQNLKEKNIVMYGFPRKTFIGDFWVSKGGWYPGVVWRLFSKEHVCFDGKELHEGLKINHGSKKRLNSDLNHFSYQNLEDYFSKMLKYAHAGAIEAHKKGKKGKVMNVFFEPLFIFFKFYFIKSGFLMGMFGLVLATGTAFSTFLRYSELWWLNQKNWKK
jgi:(heptosyl)LPS beta-1,4-glucosyltransferase